MRISELLLAELLAQCLDRSVVVRLSSYLINELGVDDLVLFIGDNNGASQQALQRGALQSNAQLLTEVRAEVGSANDVLDALCCTEALLRRRA